MLRSVAEQECRLDLVDGAGAGAGEAAQVNASGPTVGIGVPQMQVASRMAAALECNSLFLPLLQRLAINRQAAPAGQALQRSILADCSKGPVPL